MLYEATKPQVHFVYFSQFLDFTKLYRVAYLSYTGFVSLFSLQPSELGYEH